MKIRFFSDYTTSSELRKRFLSNYLITDKSLNLTDDGDYDIAVVFNSTQEWIKPGVIVICVIQEPSWSEAHMDGSFLINSDYLIIHDPDLFSKVRGVQLGGEIIKSPGYLFYNDKVDCNFFLNSKRVKKNHKLSIIVSALGFKHGNYQKRLGLLRKILDSDLQIDIYGRGFNISDPRYKGELLYKYEGLIPYEYSIAIENSCEINYITEKFVDCVICNTIPIYNGAPNIKDVYDKRYLKEIDLDSSTIIKDIKKIIEEPAPFSSINKNRYFNEYNLYTKLKQIVYGN